MSSPSFLSRRNKRRPTMPSDTGLTGGSGKGDSPRSCFSTEFRNNYDRIVWGPKLPCERPYKKTYRTSPPRYNAIEFYPSTPSTPTAPQQ